MEIRYEYRKDVVRIGKPELKPDAIYEGYNFRSVYGYPEDTAQFITDNGNTKNLKGKSVYSDSVLIDVDKEEHVDPVKQILEDNDIPYEQYTTGNRGSHFHIPIIPMIGTHVISSQIQWLKAMRMWDLIDNTIYREGGQFRTVGATHKKTRKQKCLVYSVKGEPIKIPKFIPPPKPNIAYDVVEGSPEARQAFVTNLFAKRQQGQRHMHMYILWRSGLRAGHDPEHVKDLIRKWNDQQDTPHSPDAVEMKLRGYNKK